MVRQDVINEIKNIAHSWKDDVQVILYGSQARGDATDESDIDLLILVNDTHVSLLRENELTTPLYEIELQYGESISPLVMTKNQWERRPIKTPFYINVTNEGIIL